MTGKPANSVNYDCKRVTTIMEVAQFTLRMKLKYMKLGMIAMAIPFFCIGMLLWRLRMDIYLEQQKELNDTYANNPNTWDMLDELAEKTLTVEVKLIGCEEDSHFPSFPSAKEELPHLRQRFRLFLKPLIGDSGFELVKEPVMKLRVKLCLPEKCHHNKS